MLRHKLNIINSLILFVVLSLLINGYKELNIIFVFFWLLSSLVLIFFNDSYKRFLSISALVIFFGIILIIKNKNYIKSSDIQNKVAISYAVYCVSSFLLWFNSHIADVEYKKTKNIESKLDRYIKKDTNQRLLTKAEFKDKKKFILKGASIRGEKVSFVSIELCNYYDISKKSILDKIDSILSDILISEYDIYTLENNKYQIILQNTEQNTIEVFKSKFEKRFKEDINISMKHIKFTVKEIEKRNNIQIILK